MPKLFNSYSVSSQLYGSYTGPIWNFTAPDYDTGSGSVPPNSWWIERGSQTPSNLGIVFGGAGHDKLNSGFAGNSFVDGGAGNDEIMTWYGNDYLFGGAGNDFLFSGDGNDHLYGGSGDDYLSGGNGIDFLAGGTGTDTVSYYAWDVKPIKADLSTGRGGVWGGPLEDTFNSIENLAGGLAGDYLIGDSGANEIWGDMGYDYLYGGSGNDKLHTGTDGGYAYGDGGDDTLFVGLSLSLNDKDTIGFSYLDGGSGSDTVSYSEMDIAVDASLIRGNGGSDYYVSIENLTGSNFADALEGDGNANILSGGGGYDNIMGHGGNDYLDAGDGGGVLMGGDGEDTLVAGGSMNVLLGNADNDTIDIRFGSAQEIDGGAGYDTLLLSGTADDWEIVSNGLVYSEEAGEYVSSYTAFDFNDPGYNPINFQSIEQLIFDDGTTWQV
jgi:Ca2+-binding RTX toxin-like protein